MNQSTFILYVCNAFSDNMLDPDAVYEISRDPLTLDVAKELVLNAQRNVVNAIGFPDTAAAANAALGGILPPAERHTITLGAGGYVLVPQLVGPRRDPADTTLPAVADIRWRLYSVQRMIRAPSTYLSQIFDEGA